MSKSAPGVSSSQIQPAAVDLSQFAPLPGAASSAVSVIKSSTSLTPLVCDERAIARLLAMILSKGGLSIGEASRRMGVTTNSIRQYLRGRRNKPSLMWFIRFAELNGARVTIEFPERGIK